MKKYKKYQIWEEKQETDGMLIPEDEIHEIVDLSSACVLIVESNLDDKTMDALNTAVTRFQLQGLEIENSDDMEEFLKINTVTFRSVGSAADYEKPADDKICYDFDINRFFRLSDCETIPLYEWWDGSSWRKEFGPEENNITRVTVEDEPCQDLDEFDSNGNKYTRHKFDHELVYRVIELDGDRPAGETYMVETWSQWQGTHPTAKIRRK